ncbi:MAG: hypothetical protein GPJ54_00260, partial [Candidatus Heimdallarchaeota archaeon]|nr:hypothetical protein [Candidatus Heimdallarchaeota archaeon]
YTDIGWTVKHPKKLIRALVAEGVWNEGSKDERPNNTLERMSEDPEEYENMLGAAWRDRDNMQPGK